MYRLIISTSTFLAAGLASAHPDHAEGTLDVVHQLTDPFHVTIGLLGVGAAVVLLAAWRSVNKARTLAPVSRPVSERRA